MFIVCRKVVEDVSDHVIILYLFIVTGLELKTDLVQGNKPLVCIIIKIVMTECKFLT